MKLFNCFHCGQPVYFENYFCSNCNTQLGFDPGLMEFATVAANDPQSQPTYKFCYNRAFNVCNWLIPATATEEFCVACQLNRTIPNLEDQNYRDRWQTLELAKHRLIYSMLRLSLPVVNKVREPDQGLFFDFKADGKKKVLTGHANGIITINISEADDIEREMARRNLDEVYRTVLGHFRHEIGHYYWDLLIWNTPLYAEYQSLFGNETEDYGEALKKYYEQGPPLNWQQQYISAYASAHPWEDWAETWTHYLHIVDTLETAYAYGIHLSPAAKGYNEFQFTVNQDPYATSDPDYIINQWMYFSVVLNNLNRSMGLKDAYPFVIPPPVIEKLRFVHKVCHTFVSNH